ncbi:MAG: NAD+ synthetase [Sweet potato little leaf phytoplasma]|uniref:nitrilase-related carbon-nitrogen hydrolase n=1 Tax=Candidatus Phytoplasma australasiaticum TaxID=2754999 RepID=UPI002109F3CC|nr:nitrilase-related carbon-nitrogen hydrolase [Sweet potato little leaf phytoplasma]MDO7987161.1 NAD+ synthetase [Sweet potato little leaf phytoplasma]MDO8005537.1 NAD+ synthetase [Sweet potato little leaf phytoplasma]MDO8008866.1 NAD+ synthetase [Sweet potato little leaf phytoplasma]MDO8020558.1 NAD+ synthetase [Sweet potato little leaf phytoplasma]MDV3139955.1 NAD+ synthetase [Sweet potato little leaf phytoplasma]
MYKNGFLKIELANPNLTLGKFDENNDIILSVLAKSKASFVVFPELCLSSYTAGDFFFENDFNNNILKSLDYIIKKTSFKGVYILGMPLVWQEMIFNVAIVIQQQKILGIVPKYTIPNYEEFCEKRWFTSGNVIPEMQEIIFLNQKIPFGSILFINDLYNVCFGVEICQDLWTINSPSDLLIKKGAHLIFNLSASTEHLGKAQLRRMAVINHSRKQIGGYFYVSNGMKSEMSNDVVFSNHKIAAILGNLIGEKDIFDSETNLIIDVCMDFIKHQRLIDTTYADQISEVKKIIIPKSYFCLREEKDFIFEKKWNIKPFVSESEVNSQLALANHLQCLFLCNKLSSCPDSKIFLSISPNLNDFINLLVVIQSFKLNNKKFNDLNVFIDDSDILFLDVIQDFLQKIGIDNYRKSSLLDYNDLSNNNKNINIFNHNSLSIDQTGINIFLENHNLSDISLGRFTKSFYNFDLSFNLNIGLSDTLIAELVFFHLERNDIFAKFQDLKSFYRKQATLQSNNEHVIKKDFILYYYLKYSLTLEKIAFLLSKTFDISIESSLDLTSQILKRFYQSQYQRNYTSSGPKIFENSLLERAETNLISKLNLKFLSLNSKKK